MRRIRNLFIAIGTLATERAQSILAQLIAHVGSLLAFVDVNASIAIDQFVAGPTHASETGQGVLALVVAPVQYRRGAFVYATSDFVTIIATI